MTNKTALEMLIEKINGWIDTLDEAKEKYREDEERFKCYDAQLTIALFIKVDAEKLLPTERTQIEEAFDKGKYSFGIKASDYFTQKYKDGE